MISFMENLVFLPEISDSGSSIEKASLHWVIPDETAVNKGDIIMEVILKPEKIYPVVAHQSGILIKFWNVDVNIEKSKYTPKNFVISDIPKVCIGGIFNSYKDYIDTFYKYRAKISVDSFTKEKDISWLYVAEPIINYPIFIGNRYDSFSHLKLNWNDLNRKETISEEVGTIGTLSYKKNIRIFDFFSNSVSFSFIYSEGNSYIEFSYSHNKIKLKRNDAISFLFENGNCIDFRLQSSPYKKSNKSNVRYFRCQLYAEDIENLTHSLAQKWRITFADKQMPPIYGNIGEFRKDKISFNQLLVDQFCGFKRFNSLEGIPLQIQSFTKNYVEVLKNEVPEYEHPQRSVRNKPSEKCKSEFDWHYVYLMKDTSTNYHKIGFSKTPEYRERTLQSEKPTIEMICYKKLPSRKIAESFEKALHHVFADKRVRGEWFNLDSNDVVEIVFSLQ